MTAETKAPLTDEVDKALQAAAFSRDIFWLNGDYHDTSETLRAHIAALTKEIEATKQTAAGHYLTWQCTEAGLREQIAALEAENKRLRDECRWAEGALRNAMELLEECKCNMAANQKNAAYVTLHHFLNRIKSALARPETQKCGTCGGDGYVLIQTTGHGCCGEFLPNGECCGNAIQVDTGPEQQSCPECNGTGKEVA